MSDPAELPDPEYRREWKDWRDGEADAVSLLIACHLNDEPAARFVLGGLDRAQLIELAVVLGAWFDWACDRDALPDTLGRLTAVAEGIRRWPEEDA